MKDSKIVLFLMVFFSLLVCLSFAMIACGDDDDDGTPEDDDVADDDAADDDTNDDDVADDDVSDDDVADDDAADDDAADDDLADDDTTDDDTAADDDEVPTPETVQAHFVDLITGNDIVGATCELVKNSNGQSFSPPITTVSDSDGYCLFNEPIEGDLFSMKFTKASYVDSYLYNYQTDVFWKFDMVSNLTQTAIFVLLGLTPDPTKGAVVGGVKWIDDTDPEDWTLEEVGCAEVTSSGGDTIYYFEEGMPTTERTNTNPADGFFLAMLVDPGSYTYTADTDGNVETAPIPHVFADSVVYTNINYWIDDYATNPEPALCE